MTDDSFIPVGGTNPEKKLHTKTVTLNGDELHDEVVSLADIGVTRFGEMEIALRSSQTNFKPTWGLSTLRYLTSLVGTGSAAAETSGEFRLQSGTANNGLTTVETNQRGQYQAGAMGQAGIGVRVPTAPVGTAFLEWGYTDFSNGFYFGVDAVGVYVAIVTGGSATKTYQPDWNVDTLDGNGTSGKTLALEVGYVAQIDFTWYGYGDIEFSFLAYDADPDSRTVKTVCHRIKILNAASVVDPNQPLSFRVGNGATGTTDTSLYIGGHQFSVKNGLSIPQSRNTSELLSLYTTALNTDWQPILAIRKKANFNGRANSVTVRLGHYLVATDADMELRVTVGGTTSNGTWGTPTGRTATETAIETKITSSGTPLAASADGEPTQYDFVTANTGGAGSKAVTAGATQDDATFVLGSVQEVILWVRRQDATGAMIVKHAHIELREEW